MKYPISYVSVDGNGRAVGQTTVWSGRRWMKCWATGAEYHPPHADPVAVQCEHEGDFSDTIGLCPQHYEEIIGEDPHLD